MWEASICPPSIAWLPPLSRLGRGRHVSRQEPTVDLFEHQGKEFFARYGMPVSPGEAVFSVDEAVAAAERLGARPTWARIALDCAPLLARSGGTRRARSLLEDSAKLAEELKMDGVAHGSRKQLARY